MKDEYICEYTKSEEIINSITHGIGALLSVAGLVILVVFASIHGNAWHIVSYSIFGGSMIVLYLASTLYHSFVNPKIKFFFKKMDHSAIFLLIAGTYTPFTLVHIKGGIGWTVFSIVWVLAVLGIIMKFTCIFRMKKVSAFIYVAMGWMCIFVMKNIIDSLNTQAFIYLLSGGLLYSGGVIFYVWKKLKYHHAIWHIFVLLGSVFHFFAVLEGFRVSIS